MARARSGSIIIGTGAQGFQGNQGTRGYQGFQGEKGDTGNQGEQGFQGISYYIEVVEELPVTPDEDTFYFIEEED